MGERQQAKEVFLDALEKSDAERAAFLDEACGDDAALRARVDELLDAHFGSDGVIQTSGAGLLGGVHALDVGPGDSVGPYRLLRLLGEGGFGVVFLASQERPVRRRVALKIVKLGMDTKAVIARFEVERQALALMEHPNIAKVFDAGATETGRPYFVMELVEGVPITEYCEREMLGTEQRLALFQTVCEAVQHAHQRGVLHRDLKPSNLLVTTVDGRPVPKVIDFGIAKATGGRLTEETFFTRDGFFMGTPSYMSPEQCQGALDIDTRSDVYSLGVLLYELLSGAPPFDANQLGMDALRAAICELEPPRPSTRRRELQTAAQARRPTTAALLAVPRELDWIVMRCLEKERGRRYTTAAALAVDLGRFLSDLPVEAAPPSAWYRLRKAARRHRTATIAATAVLVALVVGVVGTSVGFFEARRANRELDRALAESQRQRRVAEAINEFLTEDLLASARPSALEARGRTVTMRDVLDHAALELQEQSLTGGRFEDQPMVEAALHYAVGASYDHIGHYAESSQHLARAYELRRESLGEEDPAALEAASYLGLALDQAGEWQEAEALLRVTLERMRRVHGETAAETLTATTRLAANLGQQGHAQDSLGMLEEALATAREHHGDEADVTTELMSRLAIVYTELGRAEEAEELFQLCLEGRRASRTDGSPAVMVARTNYGTFLLARQRLDEAHALFSELLVTQREVLGPDHPGTLKTASSLVQTLIGLHRPDEAAPLAEESLAVARRVFSPGDERLIRWMAVQPRLLESAGRYEESLPGYREVWEASQLAIGADHPTTLDRANDYAAMLYRLGRTEEALEMFAAIHASWVRTQGEENPNTVFARQGLGSMLRREYRFEEARVHLEGAVAVARRAFGDEDVLTLECIASLAILEAQTGELQRAQELLEETRALEALGQGRAFAVWLTGAQYLAASALLNEDPEIAARWTPIVEGHGWYVPVPTEAEAVPPEEAAPAESDSEQ